MKIITKCVLNIETNQWLPEFEESYEYSGPLALCDIFGTGASSGDKANLASDRAFQAELTAEQAQTFGETSAEYKNIVNAWSTVLAAGPNQYGWSTAENEAIMGGITTATARATTNAENATLLRQQQLSGGPAMGPSGGVAATEAVVNALGEQSEAEAKIQATIAGYEQGNKNFTEATQATGEAAKGQAESFAAGANAVTGAENATNEAQKIVDTANANSLTNKLIGGAIGGGEAFLTGFGGGIGRGMGGPSGNTGGY